MMDGNSAAAHVAHATNEVIAIYPITPSSNMGEIADEKTAAGETNIWGTVPIVAELQSEGGASGAVHGSLTTGALTTTFTASQGLLLMIPNMYKIAGELTSAVIHVAARSLACQGLSIFGDHSDVMSTRSTGFAMLCANSVQETMDFALMAQTATLQSRIPFLHFFDGFRTSHEVNKIEVLDFDVMRKMVTEDLVKAHRDRGLSPDRPSMRGTAQNPDVYFQGRETVNSFYDKTPGIVQSAMDKFAKLTGRQYHLFDYVGAKDAERVVIMMGSGAETMHEVVEHMVSKGEKVGLVKVRLYRPFSLEHLVKAFPASVKSICVLDRTKEPGSAGEPLYIDVRNSIGEALEAGIAPFKNWPKIVGGRYGLGSKDFTPNQCFAIFDNIRIAKPKNHFTVGIEDDVTHTSLLVGPMVDTGDPSTYSAKFYGLGSDGTVGANKDTIKIIGMDTDNNAQGYFVYDSKKSGSITISHLRFGKKPLRCPYLINMADFVACHNFSFLEKIDMLSDLKSGGFFLLESPFSAAEVWDKIPAEVQQTIIDKKAKFFVLDALKHAENLGLGNRINILMQSAFFEISKILPRSQFESAIKHAVEKTYGRKSEKVVEMNCKAVDLGIQNLEEVKYPGKVTSQIHRPPAVSKEAPEFVQNVLGVIMAGKGDSLPVSKMPSDGTFPTATTMWEKRNIATSIPVWEPKTCIQCGLCSLACPHAAIRTKVYEPKFAEKAPKTFKMIKATGFKDKELSFTVQIAPEDCTGCGTCVYMCPAFEKDASGQKTERKAINMSAQPPLRMTERENFSHFMSIPDTDPGLYNLATPKGSQLVRPLFEFSGACGGCGETPYIKLLTQLFGDHLMIANATGCSSIYGGNLPSTPYCKRSDGRGPAWSNSLFEDNAEFGLGMRLASDRFRNQALELVEKLSACSCKACKDAMPLFESIKKADQSTPAGITAQRENITKLKTALKGCPEPEAQRLIDLADNLVKRSVWILGGDGWAYDIGYGGLDHVLASGQNVKLLVLDTEVYSNTGGQMSKSTPMGAVARFAAGGKPLPKKDLGMMAMAYGNIYVAKVALGSNPSQVVKAMMEAEAYNGPAIIIAYSTCIAHGIDMSKGIEEQRKAVNCGHWPLFRFNPDMINEGKNPLQMDSAEPTIALKDYIYGENRYKSLTKSNPAAAEKLLHESEKNTSFRQKLYRTLAAIDVTKLKS
ncbi:MAG: pyruvate:ferredoxin (flavodoxin) oxidoreductase [Candidatus Riflebacteria bacterium]|nr:pyruvate:ferredoxin (flavodoxin) oxidoreductase [Candidatus Riflebacteria bacterium]